MRIQPTNRILVVLISLLAIVVLLVTGCDNDDGPEPQDRVMRLTPVVWAGSPAANPPLLNHNNWKNLSTGDAVTTDTDGEAELQLDGCDGSIYVFKNSSVIHASTCRKTAQGLGTCGQQGTGYYNVVCSGRFTVNTYTARVTIVGTAFSVTYLPERQLTLVIVFEKSVTVQPVLDVAAETYGPDVAVSAGYFLYTMPGPVSPEIEGVPARQARPLEELPLLVTALGIRPWMDDLRGRAQQDNVLPDNWPYEGGAGERGQSAVRFSYAGGPLEDPRVQEAVLAAINKDALAESAFPGQDVAFLAAVGDQELDARAIPHDPDRSRELLAEAGYPDGFGLRLLFPQEDEQLAAVAEIAIAALDEVALGVKPVPVPAAEMDAFVDEFVAAGEPTLWLTRLGWFPTP